MMAFRWLVPAIVASALAACTHRPAPPSFTLSLLGTNDVHGGVLEEGGRGGLALLGGYVANVRAARQSDGGAVLLLDAGDLFQGTLESNLNEGAVVVEAYNAIGYDAATIGNHEFDYGPAGDATIPRSPGDDPRGALKARLGQSGFPWVAANLLDAQTRTPVSWPNVQPSIVRTVNGVKVGVVGLITAQALSYAMAANVTGLAIAPLADTLRTEASRLRSEGATIVIALAHAGGKCLQTTDPRDLSSCEANAEIFDLARAMPAGLVDAIVSGHRHERIAQEVNGIPIIESFRSAQALGRIDFVVDRASGRVVTHRLYPPRDLCARQVAGQPGCAAPDAVNATAAEYEGRPVQPSAQVAALLQPAVDQASTLKARPLGTARMRQTLPFSDVMESPVGDLEADWMRAIVPGADAALLNSGGIRAQLPEGPLTYGRLYRLLPFDNQRVVLNLSGAQMKRILVANVSPGAGTSFIILSGVRASIACDSGQVAVTLTRTNGRTVRDNERLRIVTSDFLATGGDSFLTPIMPVPIASSGGLLRDEIAAVIEKDGGAWGLERLGPRPRITGVTTRPLNCSIR